jgi:hypothetical protein
MRLCVKVFCVLLACLWPSAFAVPASVDVDVALALAIDVSMSVDDLEHELQMKGFAEALQSPDVLKAIKGGAHQRIAVAVYQWSDPQMQTVIVPWTIIESEDDVKRVAVVLNAGERIGQGGTAISNALLFGAELLAQAPLAERRVIDLATDGRNNVGRPVKEIRDVVVASGITINGLAISNEWKSLGRYLETNVMGGTLSFVEDAENYDDFGATMLRKLVREIAGPGLT